MLTVKCMLPGAVELCAVCCVVVYAQICSRLARMCLFCCVMGVSIRFVCCVPNDADPPPFNCPRARFTVTEFTETLRNARHGEKLLLVPKKNNIL